MKPWGTLKFFAAVVALLALLCILFPKDGINIGFVTLRFPSLHKVLVHEKEKSMDQLLVKREERDLSGALDSLEDCYHVIFETQTRFWLPNDDVSFFDSFFEKAEKAQSEKKIVRVMHYGDSQIEQDRISCRLRERLQMTFGGGGPGLPSASTSRQQAISSVNQPTATAPSDASTATTAPCFAAGVSMVQPLFRYTPQTATTPRPAQDCFPLSRFFSTTDPAPHRCQCTTAKVLATGRATKAVRVFTCLHGTWTPSPPPPH